jgi:hypothetical protein
MPESSPAGDFVVGVRTESVDPSTAGSQGFDKVSSVVRYDLAAKRKTELLSLGSHGKFPDKEVETSITSLAVSPDGASIAVVCDALANTPEKPNDWSESGSVTLLNAKTGAKIHRWSFAELRGGLADNYKVSQVAFIGSHRLLVEGYDSTLREIKTFDVATGASKRVIGTRDEIWLLGAAPSGKRYAVYWGISSEPSVAGRACVYSFPAGR